MIHVICSGNPLHADDGFGAAIFHRLANTHWPSGVRIVNAIGKALSLDHFRDCRRAIVLDVFAPSSGAPGEIRELDAVDHLPGLDQNKAAIMTVASRTLLPRPQIEIWGPVAALKTPFAPGLSPLVAAAVGTVTAMLVRELDGKPQRQAPAPRPPRLGSF